MLDGLESSIEPREDTKKVKLKNIIITPTINNKVQEVTTDGGLGKVQPEISLKSGDIVNELEPLRKSTSGLIDELDGKAFKLGLLHSNSIEVNGTPTFSTISMSQVIQGKRRIRQELTPLKDMPIDTLFPILKCCSGYLKRRRK